MKIQLYLSHTKNSVLFFHKDPTSSVCIKQGKSDESQSVLDIISICNLCKIFEGCSFNYKLTLKSQNWPQRPNLWTFQKV